MTDQASSEKYRIVIVFTGSGYAADAMAHVVSSLEGRGHHVDCVSYGGLAAEAARSLASRGMRGIRAAVRTVTGKLVGDDPLGLAQGQVPRYDVVLATEPELIAATRTLAGDKTVRAGLMSTLQWSSAWADAEADALIVPHPIFKELARRRGWREESVFVGGVPLPEAFCLPLDVAAIVARFGLDPSKGAVVLVDAEHVDESRLERLIFQLSLVDHPIQPIIHIGENRRAGDVLRKAAGAYGVMARMFGTVENLQEYYAASDIVLTPVANPRLYALLALDKPVLLLDADARPEAMFLHDEGAAIVVPDVLRLGVELDALLASPEEMARLRKGAAAVVDQQGVARVVASIEAVAAARPELLAPPAEPAQPALPAGGGAFEVIGGGTAGPPVPGSPSVPRVPTGMGSASRAVETFERHSVRRLSRAEAKEEMAALIMMERDVEKRLSQATQLVARWEGRLDLARRASENELAGEAERFLDNYRREEGVLLQELDRIRAQKGKLKRMVNPGLPPDPAPSSDSSRLVDMEGRFRAMEVNKDLDQLKNRIRRDYGDE